MYVELLFGAGAGRLLIRERVGGHETIKKQGGPGVYEDLYIKYVLLIV